MYSKVWIDYWKTEKFVSANPKYQCCDVFGSSTEPLSSIWCACFFESIRDLLINKEPI